MSNNGLEAAVSITADTGDAVSISLHGLNSLTRTIWTLSRNYQSFMDAAVEPYGISYAQVPLLTYLWEGHTGDTQNDIARNLGVDKGTVSRNVQQLVRLKLVNQTCSSKDSRACRVELTEQGRSLAEPVMRALREWTEGVCREMNEGRRLHVLLELNRMVEHSEQLGPEAPAMPRPPLVASVALNAASAGASPS